MKNLIMFAIALVGAVVLMSEISTSYVQASKGIQGYAQEVAKKF